MGRFNRTKAGVFLNINKIGLVWEEPDWFRYTPDIDSPFGFSRHNGETIVPKEMFFDGGSTPRLTRVFARFSPWYYTPVALIHDWLVEEQVLGNGVRTFRESIDIQQEALKTLMLLKPQTKSKTVFHLTRIALRTRRSRDMWSTPVRVGPPISIACKKDRLRGRLQSQACGFDS